MTRLASFLSTRDAPYIAECPGPTSFAILFDFSSLGSSNTLDLFVYSIVLAFTKFFRLLKIQFSVAVISKNNKCIGEEKTVEIGLS